jgi:hypothetical protein
MGQIGKELGGYAGEKLGRLAGSVLGGMLPFKKGGKVKGKTGAPVKALLHGGEYVIPAGKLNAKQKADLAKYMKTKK